MEPGDTLAKFIIRIVSRRQIVERVHVAGATIQFYDWLLILPQEVEYIWRASWNWSKVLYLLVRYIVFAPIALQLRNRFTSNPTPESCDRNLKAICWIVVVGMDLAEIVLLVRTYAIWKRDKRVGIGLALLLLLAQIPTVIFLKKFLQGTGAITNPYKKTFPGCLWGKGTRIVFANWVVFAIEEGVVLVLMIISALRTYRENTSNLMDVIYRDGIRFYLYMFCVTSANFLSTLLLPADFAGVGSDFVVVLHSALTCRLMIGIREASHSCGRKSDTFELSEVPHHSTIEFAPRPLGESTDVDPEAGADLKDLTSRI